MLRSLLLCWWSEGKSNWLSGAWICRATSRIHELHGVTTKSARNSIVVHLTCYYFYSHIVDSNFFKSKILKNFSTMYFGEFPLSFAACMNHPDCVRLLHAYKVHWKTASIIYSNVYENVIYLYLTGQYQRSRHKWQHGNAHVCHTWELG